MTLKKTFSAILYYRNFIKALNDVAIDNSDYDAQKRIAESFNSLIIIAAPKVVYRLMEFHNFIKTENTEIPRNSREWSEKHDHLLRQLVITIREDLYGREKDIDSLLAGVHLVSNKRNKIKKNFNLLRTAENFI